MSDHRLYSFGNPVNNENISLDSKVDLSENDDVRNDQTKGQDNYQHSGLISRALRFGRDMLDIYRFKGYM
ncbi:MAG: hypothetical protein AABW91_02030 [Nanoarchaeota archaeon]